MIQQLEAQCFEEHTGIFVLLTHRGFKILEYLDETIIIFPCQQSTIKAQTIQKRF